MPLFLRYAVRSDLGLVRGNNEDAVYAGPRLLAIADGMGGHAAGEVASQIAIGALQPLDDDRPIDDLMAELREAVVDGNQEIAAASARDSALEGMGTTLTALRFSAAQVGLVHVGDSRAYLLRGDQLSQITHDDTYVQFLVDSGKLTEDEAKDHPRKSVILRALTGTEVEPDVSIREARAGDRYLLCTDGLSDVITPETIGETMRIPDVQECADRLVELALRGGGPDNVTVIVADVVNARVGDMVDDVPVVAGALVDPKAADGPTDDSPAERAARMTRAAAAPTATPATTPPPKRRRRMGFRLRLALILIGVVVLIVGGLGGTYAWAQTQYFVGRDGDEVAIFRGVNAEFGPLKFFKVYQNAGISVDDLYPTYRAQVNSGINARNIDDASSILVTLRTEVMPLCTTPSAPPSAPPSPSGSATGSASSGHSAASTSGPVATPPHSRASSSGSPSVNASDSGSGTQSGSSSDSSSSSSGPPAPVQTPEPNVDCRTS